MNDLGKDSQLDGCHESVQYLEDALAVKSKELTQQVMYNSLVLIIGLIMGFLFARLWRKK